MFQSAVIHVFGIGGFTRLDGIVASLCLDFHAVFLTFGYDVVGLEGFQRHRTADTAFDLAVERRAFFHIHAADDIRIDIVAVVCAEHAAPDGNRLLGAVDGNGDAPLPLHAADIGVERAAVARFAAVDSGQAAEEVGYGVAFKGFDILLAFVEVDDFAGINSAFTDFIFIACAFDGNGIENDGRRIIGSINDGRETNDGDAGGKGVDFDWLHNGFLVWRNVRQRRLKVFRRPRKGFAASQIGI